MTPSPVHLTLARVDADALIDSLEWTEGVGPAHATDLSRQLRRIRAELQAALVVADARAAEPDDEPWSLNDVVGRLVGQSMLEHFHGIQPDASAAEGDPSHRDEPLLGRFLACGEG